MEGRPDEGFGPLAQAEENVRVDVEVRLGVAFEQVEDVGQCIPGGDAGQGVQGGQADDGLVVEELDEMDGLLGPREIDEETDVLEPYGQPGRS